MLIVIKKSYDVLNDDSFIVVSKVLDTKNYKEIHPLFEIVDINRAKMLKKEYTIIGKEKESLEKLLYLLVCDKEEDLEKIYDGDGLMEKVLEKAQTVVDELDKLLYYNYEELKKGEAYDEGYDAGAEHNTKEIAINMLKKNFDILSISEVTKLSIEDLEKLKEEL